MQPNDSKDAKTGLFANMTPAAIPAKTSRKLGRPRKPKPMSMADRARAYRARKAATALSCTVDRSNRDLRAAIRSYVDSQRTVLPAALNTPLNSRKTRVGEMISARIMQEVPLAPGAKIHAGTKLVGYIVDVKPASNTDGAKLPLRFDTSAVSRRPKTRETPTSSRISVLPKSH